MSKIIVDNIESTGTTVTVNDNISAGTNTITSGAITAAGNIDAGTNAVTAGSVTGLTATSITSGTLPSAQLPVGTIINSEMFTNSTRTALSTSSGTAFWSVSYTKKLADSVLFVIANVRGWADSSGICGSYVEIDGTKYYSAGYTYNGHNYGHVWFGTASKQVSTSGTKTISVGWQNANGASDRPFELFNYNSTDDARSQQAVSTIQVMEVTV